MRYSIPRDQMFGVKSATTTFPPPVETLIPNVNPFMNLMTVVITLGQLQLNKRQGHTHIGLLMNVYTFRMKDGFLINLATALDSHCQKEKDTPTVIKAIYSHSC